MLKNMDIAPYHWLEGKFLGRLKAWGEGDNRGWDGWMAPPTQWTWVWASSGRWWRTGKPGVLPSMGSQRLGHDWATEQQQRPSLRLLLWFIRPWASQVVLAVKNPPASAGDIRDGGSISGLGWSPGGEHSSPLHYPCLENPMDWGAWWAIVHRVAKSWKQLKWLSVHAYI